MIAKSLVTDLKFELCDAVFVCMVVFTLSLPLFLSVTPWRSLWHKQIRTFRHHTHHPEDWVNTPVTYNIYCKPQWEQHTPSLINTFNQKWSVTVVYKNEHAFSTYFLASNTRKWNWTVGLIIMATSFPTPE